MGLLLWFILSGVGVAVAVAIGQSWGAVTRDQVTSFARRQRLPITIDNGDQVIRYLAHTRRWRVAGVLAGAVLAVAVGLPGRVTVNFGVLFAGWFAGAIVAEVRLARGPIGPRRVASLTPRIHQQYVGPLTWWLVPFAMLTSLMVFLGGHPFGSSGWLWFGLVSSAAVTAATLVVRVRVVRRAQVQLAPDRLAADDAIRSRSLHVLCAGGAALVLQCVGIQLIHVGLAGPAEIVTFGGALLGWLVGTARFTAGRRPDPAGATVAA